MQILGEQIKYLCITDLKYSVNELCEMVPIRLKNYLKDHLSFLLRDVTVQHMGFNANWLANSQLICILFSLAEDHGPALGATVHAQDVTHSGSTVSIVALQGQMLLERGNDNDNWLHTCMESLYASPALWRKYAHAPSLPGQCLLWTASCIS